MFVVALTGGIGCGKSAATEIFAELGVNIVDVDVISHKLTAIGSPVLNEISAAFGKEVLDEAGALNRRKMRQLIFKDALKRLKLEAILHPAIHTQALQELNFYMTLTHQQVIYQILAIPLLTENSRYQDIISRVLVIDCDEDLQIKRTMQRSKLSDSEVRNIISNQISRENRLKLADDVIENNENLDKLRKKIELIHKKYINTCIVTK
ncbi:MAG: dephospho-CoA kinase [Methylophilaceae bacterium]|nr:dephospho-CoA kinase [Methylophilaceae bacterium]